MTPSAHIPSSRFGDPNEGLQHRLEQINAFCRNEPTDDMIERAARALYAQSPCPYDVGYDASPDRGVYDSAARAALAAAFSTQQNGDTDAD